MNEYEKELADLESHILYDWKPPKGFEKFMREIGKEKEVWKEKKSESDGEESKSAAKKEKEEEKTIK